QLPVDTILSYSPILHMCVSRLTIQQDSSHCAWGLGRYCPAGCHFPHGAGIGDFTTGMLAPFVAYAWYSGKPYARSAAIAWNLFGMADLVNAVVLGALTNGVAGGIVFPIVLIPVYGVPRVFLIHSYSESQSISEAESDAGLRSQISITVIEPG